MISTTFPPPKSSLQLLIVGSTLSKCPIVMSQEGNPDFPELGCWWAAAHRSEQHGALFSLALRLALLDFAGFQVWGLAYLSVAGNRGMNPSSTRCLMLIYTLHLPFDFPSFQSLLTRGIINKVFMFPSSSYIL